MEAVDIDALAAFLLQRYRDVREASHWGERAFFVNPGDQQPRGTYFLTLKLRDSPNDGASALQPGDYRLNLGLPDPAYVELFGPRPPRPSPGVATHVTPGADRSDVLIPHPVYAWMGWVAIKNPSASSLRVLEHLLDEAYSAAVVKLQIRQRRLARRRAARGGW